ncbi:hypothetical protein CGMCC3_g12820 [Colletotrichum fructicola]|nr:uncharacterized protein CGMCC3_g12820 [Colletotrichum fructicola]KAE9571171.1 hypothetical protein CGMCC3_g12820 [Colletotrichum fructicola]
MQREAGLDRTGLSNHNHTTTSSGQACQCNARAPSLTLPQDNLVAKTFLPRKHLLSGALVLPFSFRHPALLKPAVPCPSARHLGSFLKLRRPSPLACVALVTLPCLISNPP